MKYMNTYTSEVSRPVATQPFPDLYKPLNSLNISDIRHAMIIK